MMKLEGKIKEKIQPDEVISLLNELLANAIAFKLSAKQAHWNVRGRNFISLHELFDQVSTEVDGYIDMIAERVVQLGGTAQGTAQVVFSQSSLPDYPVSLHEGQDHLKELTTMICVLADAYRHAINVASSAGDMVTADLFTEATRGFDKLHWLIRSHMG